MSNLSENLHQNTNRSHQHDSIRVPVAQTHGFVEFTYGSVEFTQRILNSTYGFVIFTRWCVEFTHGCVNCAHEWVGLTERF